MEKEKNPKELTDLEKAQAIQERWAEEAEAKKKKDAAAKAAVARAKENEGALAAGAAALGGRSRTSSLMKKVDK